ncbi:leukocyte surface antigen CD53 [Aethina tumida]|uniref:leukocyte surface antigen CD53 n=1 Tax=Aethina tumida TaxID=116153 RepID=UPI00096B3405|nr:leukocyte surface antigen CD53 [Aethina tumida]
MASLKLKEVFCVVYSILLFVSGVLLIAFSVFLAYKLFYHFKFVSSGCIGPFIVIFLLGFIHLLLTWLGIKGPAREHDFHIYLFIAITIILAIIEFTVGVWSMILWGEVRTESTNLLTESFDEMIKIDYNKKEWVRLQSQLKCCGLNGSHDYAVKDSYPKACSNLDLSNGTFQLLYEDGCSKRLIKYVKTIMVEGASMGFLSCAFQGFGVFIFYIFIKELKQERSRRIAKRLQLQREAAAAAGQQTPAPLPS